MSVERLFDPQAFALEVRVAMATANVSFRQLEAICGVDQASIHRLAKKALPPSVETYLRLRQWMDSPPPFPMGGEDRPKGER